MPEEASAPGAKLPSLADLQGAAGRLSQQARWEGGSTPSKAGLLKVKPV
jgi:hypothetical protein